jgi:putative ABC transport system permease protein
MLSIILSLAGVFGLVLLNIQQKTKEIGIRKVLGAGIPDIIKMTAGNFVVLIALASIIAIPGAWYYAGNWLQNFAYRIELHWWIFAASGMVVLLFAIILISIQTAKAAMANPVNSLRAE